MSLRISYSGVRGIVGESLTPEVAYRFGRAFREILLARYENPTVITARDTRPSGPELTEAVIAGLGDFKRYDLGVVPTPTAQFALPYLKAQGAVVVTASHNPMQWNGFKFMLCPPATVLDGPQTKELMRRIEETYPPAPPPEEGEDLHEALLKAHRDAVLRQVDAEKIRKRKFRVGYDSGLGAGRESTLALLQDLGCEVIEITDARESEPIPAHLGPLQRAVSDNRADLGLAQDLDADRLALVTEQGLAPGEHLTLVLVLEHLLQTQKGPCTVVKNLSTTRAVDDVAERFGAPVVEVPVGEVNLSRALETQVNQGRTAFGGEGNGGVIFPPLSLGRDSLMGVALVLEALASQPQPLSERLGALPRYYDGQIKLPADRPLAEACERLETAFPEATPSREDGLKLSFPDYSWLGLRASNTEPILRLSAEARSPERSQELLDRASSLL